MLLLFTLKVISPRGESGVGKRVNPGNFKQRLYQLLLRFMI